MPEPFWFSEIINRAVLKVNISRVTAVLLATVLPISTGNAQDLASEVAQLRLLLAEVQQDYESRITDLEERLTRAERLAAGARRDAQEAYDVAEQTAIDQSSGSSSPNTFNPAIGAVLAEGSRTSTRHGTRYPESCPVVKSAPGVGFCAW